MRGKQRYFIDGRHSSDRVIAQLRRGVAREKEEQEKLAKFNAALAAESEEGAPMSGERNHDSDSLKRRRKHR